MVTASCAWFLRDLVRRSLRSEPVPPPTPTPHSSAHRFVVGPSSPSSPSSPLVHRSIFGPGSSPPLPAPSAPHLLRCCRTLWRGVVRGSYGRRPVVAILPPSRSTKASRDRPAAVCLLCGSVPRVSSVRGQCGRLLLFCCAVVAVSMHFVLCAWGKGDESAANALRVDIVCAE